MKIVLYLAVAAAALLASPSAFAQAHVRQAIPQYVPTQEVYYRVLSAYSVLGKDTRVVVLRTYDGTKILIIEDVAQDRESPSKWVPGMWIKWQKPDRGRTVLAFAGTQEQPGISVRRLIPAPGTPASSP